MKQQNIRNFSIIAHIDHGKSTLADRIIEKTDSISHREMREQLLDNMDIERERGITIKLNAVNLKYRYQGEDYYLNLIDTPGHVDFSYEVSRSLAACEGAILVVDATQGIEAQTLANFYLALNNNLTIIPIINKIDLPNADVNKVKKELVEEIGFDEDEIILTSAKTGEGIEFLLTSIIERIKAPTGDNKAKLQGLIFDSYFDSYRGVIISVCIKNGILKKGDIIKTMATGSSYEVLELGINNPKHTPKEQLITGEVGYVSAAIKSLEDIQVGDTITIKNDEAINSLPGYQAMKSMVFCGLYPIESNKYDDLKEAIGKLKLNDASLSYEPETSKALGFGFRCGFLGLLHMEITIERIKREFKIDLIATSPSVIYEVVLTDNSLITVETPTKLPERTKIHEIKEPFIKANIYTPAEYIGSIMEICQNKRGFYLNMNYLSKTRVNIQYKLPLAEIVYDFFDKLKSATKGYASFDYEMIGYEPSNLVKMDILLNGEVVDALSVIVHKDFAYKRGKAVVEVLKSIIPRQMFEVPIQASIGSSIIARSDIKAMRKNVLAKCYGGDVSRKKKLLEKQKEGIKKMKRIGNIEIPQEAFLSILKVDND